MTDMSAAAHTAMNPAQPLTATYWREALYDTANKMRDHRTIRSLQSHTRQQWMWATQAANQDGRRPSTL